MSKFIVTILSLSIIRISYAHSLDSAQYSHAPWINDAYVGSGCPTNINILIPVNGESTQFFKMDFE